ncbi:MAG: TonB-dependent receptor [Agriterribacter sp.]
MTKKAISPKHPLRPVYKALVLMNGITLFLMAVSLQVSATGFAQKKINLEVNTAPLTEVLKQIEQNTIFRFVYSTESLQDKMVRGARFKKADLTKVMEQLLDNTALTYKMINDSLISIGEKKEGTTYILHEEMASIKGKVVDEKGQPLAGVSILVSGTQRGTIADEKGEFVIDAKRGETLEFSIVGYKLYRIKLGNETSLNIKLEPDAADLNSVVVIGYGTQKKKDLTGSISSVSSDHLNLGGTTANMAQAIQGRAAGVRVQQSDFSPGGAMSVVIRGGNSFSTTTEPLYVVDGFISDNGKFINPNDIDDIQVLKDASATAIYGARGGNGVVLITTKKGKNGKMQVDAEASNGIQNLTYKPSLLTGEQYAAIQNATAAEDGKPPVFPSSFPIANTNWWDLTTQQATTLNRSLSFSGSDKTTRFYLSGNYFKQNGVLKNTSMERYSVRMGMEKNFNERLKVGANFYGASTNSRLQRYVADITAPLYSILTAAPAIPVYNADGSYYKYLGKDNALALLTEPTNVSTNRLINGNMFADYQIIKNLTYHFSAGAEFSQVTAGQYTPKTLVAGQANGGIAQEQMGTAFRWLAEQYLTYKFDIGVHAFTILGGASSQKDVFEGLAAGSSSYSSDVFLFYNLYAGAKPTVQGASIPASSKTESKLGSYYGRINYAYNDKILATFTLRDDISSRFGPNNRHGIFPSGAVAWRMSDESFIKELNTFSNLKLRVSYGITGNDRIGDYAYLTRFSPYSTVLNPGSGLSAGVEPASLPNNDLKWESTAQTDIGLDMSFLNGRLSATIDVYKKKTSDLLLAVPVGQWWGFSTQTINAGTIQNKGIELSVTSDNFKGGNFTWSTTFNIALNKQKVLGLAKNVSIISTNTANPSGTVSGREFTRIVPGRELGELFGYEYAGVIKTGETYAPQPLSKPGDPKYVDVNKDGKITPDDATYLGNTNPRYIAGISNDFRYKGFDLSIFFQGAFHYKLYNMNRLVLESTTSTDALNRWVAGTNENTDIPREGYFLGTYGSYVNSRFVENASYVRLKNVAIGYTITPKLLGNVKFIDGIRIYASGQNLLTFTKYTGTDPESNTHTAVNVSGSNLNVNTVAPNNTAGGIDFNGFPAYRTFVFGIKLTIH